MVQYTSKEKLPYFGIKKQSHGEKGLLFIPKYARKAAGGRFSAYVL